MTRGAPSDLNSRVAARLRAVGQRYTAQREALVEALKRAGKPLSTAEIVEARTGPQSSVYRNLSVFERAGVARRVIAEDGFARYELTEDLTEHHHHLICTRCGRVEDVTIPPDVESSMDRTVDTLAKRSGFAKVRHRLDLIGTCRACA